MMHNEEIHVEEEEGINNGRKETAQLSAAEQCGDKLIPKGQVPVVG